MVIATPFKSPCKIGRDRKSVKAPNRKWLAKIHQNPVIAVIIIASCHLAFSSPADNGITTAAITAQVAASGPVIN